MMFSVNRVHIKLSFNFKLDWKLIYSLIYISVIRIYQRYTAFCWLTITRIYVYIYICIYIVFTHTHTHTHIYIYIYSIFAFRIVLISIRNVSLQVFFYQQWIYSRAACPPLTICIAVGIRKWKLWIQTCLISLKNWLFITYLGLYIYIYIYICMYVR